MSTGMTNGMHDLLREAADELRQQQARLKSIRGELQDVTFKATSKDRMITVTIDTTGEVSSIAFNTAKFRRMAPAELGAILVETIRQARAESRDRVLGAYRSLLPSGMGLADMFAGQGDLDLDKIFDDAFRQANETFASMRPRTAGRSARKDERS
jgi:DNA-binding protein YbaB